MDLESVQSEENPELQKMQARIIAALHDPEISHMVRADFEHTFEQCGLEADVAVNLCEQVCKLLVSDRPITDIEADALALLKTVTVKVDGLTYSLPDVLHQKLRDRAYTIYAQIASHIVNINGPVIDYGAGDGQVTQLLHDELGVSIEGFDLRAYKSPNVSVPVHLFDGQAVPRESGSYEAGILTNVLHHEKDNERIICDLSRLVTKKLVIIETVPAGQTEEELEKDKERTFMNDYLYNRLFHNADVPVPGTFETAQNWVSRFARHGWNLVHGEDLGFDQPTIRDRHYLYVFSR
jgi:hypothetical protein